MKNKLIRDAVVVSIACSMILTLSFHINSSVNNNESYASGTQTSVVVNESEIIEMISKVNKTDITRYLEDFVAFGPKRTGSAACDECATYIFNTFKQMGFHVEYHNWSFPLIKGKNVIATHYGLNAAPDPILIICSHYDTFCSSPGANDDGSGIAALLTIADIMREYQFNHTIRFIAFSGHEQGTYGSFAYAKQAAALQENILAVLSVDMIGNTTGFCKKIQIHKAERTEWISHFTLDVAEKYNDYLPVVVEPIAAIAGADEKSFLDCGYDAVLFHQPHSWLPEFHDHEPGDNLTTVNVDFLVNVTKLILALTVELGNKPIDLQIRIIEPSEGYFYSYHNFKLKLPGENFYDKKIRGMTYIQGGFTVKFNISITEDDTIDVVYCIIDGDNRFNRCTMESPYEINITKYFLHKKSIRTGLHTFRFLVTTYSGKTAYDEMDIFLLP